MTFKALRQRGTHLVIGESDCRAVVLLLEPPDTRLLHLPFPEHSMRALVLPFLFLLLVVFFVLGCLPSFPLS